MNLRNLRLLALFLTLALVAAEVRANEEEAEEEEVDDDKTKLRGVPKSGIKMADEEGKVKLKCIYNATEQPIEWFQVSGGQETKLDPETTLIEFDREKGISRLELNKEQVVRGDYLCRATDGSEKTFTVSPFFKVEKFPKSTKVDEADDLKLKCQMRPGSEDSGTPTFEWFNKNEEEPEAEGVKITPNATDSVDGEPHLKITLTTDPATNMPMSVLKIEDARYDDRSIYQCIVKNEHGQEMSVQTLVRVKDKYAALYPFAGIVAEVIILCLVIFLCEKRRTSKEAEEEAEAEADQGYNGTTAGGANSNARRRN